MSAPFVEPVVPSREKTPAEIAQSAEILAQLRELHVQAVHHNIAVAVKLAQQALCGHGPLVDHFSNLGRDWGHLLNEKPARPQTRSRFSVIQGGVA